MTKEEVLRRIEEFRSRAGHKNAPGCAVCLAINMLMVEMGLIDGERRIVDGIIITGPDA